MGIIRFLKKRRAKSFKTKHKIGLCLSGGGTRGFCYLGAFKALAEANIKFDAVAGTSVGSIFAALYASGVDYSEMQRIVSTIKTSDFRNAPLGVFTSSTDRLETLIKERMPIKNLEDAKVELYIPAVDLYTGAEVDFSKGEADKIIAGSCAVPGAFSPVKYGDYLLIDGGCKNNVPADVLRDNGCDYVVTIDCNANRGGGTRSRYFFDRFGASLDIMSVNNSKRGLSLSDIIIAPDLARFSPMKVDGKEDMIEEGYKATKQAIFKIQALMKGKHKTNETKDDEKINN